MNYRNLPYPELVRSNVKGPFTVFGVDADHPFGQTNLVDREMWVPTTDARQGVRRHEMGHAAWSPRVHYSVEGVDPTLLIMLEEARVNLGTARIGLPVSEALDADTLEKLTAAAEISRTRVPRSQMMPASPPGMHKVWAALAALGVQATDPQGAPVDLTGKFGPEAQVIADYVQGELLRMASEADAAVCTPGQLEQLAVRVQEMFPKQPWNKASQSGQQLGGGKGSASGNQRCSCVIGQAGGKDADEAAGQHKGQGLTDFRRGRGGGSEDYATMMRQLVPSFGFSAMTARPGVMSVLQPPLTKPIVDRFGKQGRKASSTDEGTVLRSPHRWAIDRAVFARKRKRATGGTVLVDWSGSMEWEEQAMQELLAAAPGTTTLALYNGEDEKGQLVVVARNGRRVPRLPKRRYGGNVVDAPAVTWLATQQEPRIWVTDFGVTGHNNQSGPDLDELCLRLAMAGNVHISREWQPVLEMLRGKTTEIPAGHRPAHYMDALVRHNESSK